uniref:Uncharacterized protein n=1 Tax=viral metagenome TaxID=1070528 RepID=A0A6M3M215_9ZZZZ
MNIIREGQTTPIREITNVLKQVEDSMAKDKLKIPSSLAHTIREVLIEIILVRKLFRYRRKEARM